MYNSLKYDPNMTIKLYKNDLEREKRSMKQISNSSLQYGPFLTPKQTKINCNIATKFTKSLCDNGAFKNLSKEKNLKSIENIEDKLNSITLKAFEKALKSTDESFQSTDLQIEALNFDAKFSRKSSNAIASFSAKKFLTSFIFNFISAFEPLISTNKITKKELVLSVVCIITGIVELFMGNSNKNISEIERNILKVF